MVRRTATGSLAATCDWKRLGWLLAMSLLVFAVCRFGLQTLPPAYESEKKAAVELAQRAQFLIGDRIIGPEYTLMTTTLAPRAVKLLSRHPDFAAVSVGWLKEAGIGAGSRVAVNLSGSFPALNIAVLSALQAVGAEPVITSSVGASTWGANDPEYTWLDMEADLAQAGLWHWRSAAASVGGVWDRGGGLAPEGKEMALDAICRSGVLQIHSVDLQQAIQKRLTIYRGEEGKLPDLLVNVGGSHVFFGEAGHRAPLPQGLNRGYHPLLSRQDGLAAVFLQSNRPVIHVLNIAQLAAQYGINADTPPQESRAFRAVQLPTGLRAVAAGWVLAVLALLQRGRRKQRGS